MSPRADDGDRMAKFVQICASRNDLFALAPEAPERGERGRRRR